MAQTLRYPHTKQLGELSTQLQIFSELAQNYGYSVKPVSATGLSQYLALEEGVRKSLTAHFGRYVEHMVAAQKAGVDLSKEQDVLKYVLPRMGLSASDEAMNYVTDGDILEVYNSENIQIFRNLKFMDVCNYSLLDLIAFPFFELYERSSLITERLLEMAEELLRTDSEGIPVEGRVPAHVMKEKFAPQAESYMVKIKKIFPLYSGPQRRSALLVVQTGYPVDAHRAPTPPTLTFL